MKPSQSLAGYIREHLTVLERRLELGIRQDFIVSELATIGYKTTVKSFRNLLYRARLNALKKPTFKTQLVEDKKNVNESVETKSAKPKNPPSKRSGFQYKGTLDVKENDLI